MSDDLEKSKPPRPFQFRLSEMFVFITVFCITFGLLGRFGLQGVVARVVATMLLVTPFLLLVFVLDFFHWLRLP